MVQPPELVQDGSEFALIKRVHLGRRLLASGRCINAKKWRAGDEDMPTLDQLGKVTEEQRQQQHLYVRAVHVGIGEDADLAVTQTAEVGLISTAMGIDAKGH